MNRYELHKAMKEAEKRGYEAGCAETLRKQQLSPPKTSYLGSFGSAPGVSINGKYHCKVEWFQKMELAAYEIRATLIIGRKFYNAVQVVGYQTWADLQSSGSFKDYVQRWLDGAYLAMWKEFKKDVLFEFTNLDGNDSPRW